MSAQSVDWLAIAAPCALALAALLALLVDLWPAPRWAPLGVSLAGVGAATASVVALWGQARGTFCVPPVVDGDVPSCSYVVDALTLTVQAIVLGGTAVVLLLAAAEAADLRLPRGELHFLVLSASTGALVLAASRDLATMVIALEVVTLPAFALVGLRRDGKGAEAALTFFLVSVVSVAVTLYGVALVYGVTGTLHLSRIQSVLAAGVGDRSAVAVAGVLLVVVGFAFKVAIVPFHLWVPDSYTGAPVTVAAYLSVVSKAAGVVGLLVVLTQGFAVYVGVWGPALAVGAALTMTIGNLGALRQRQAVRLLAWSSVAQAGFTILPLGVVGSTSPGELGPALSAAVGYLAIYSVVNLGAFAVLAVVARSRPALLLSDLRGLARHEPASALALAFFLLCLAGLPPGVAGLWAKVVVLQSAVTTGPGWLAVVAALNTAIGLVYYLGLTALLFARPADDRAAVSYDMPTLSTLAVGFILAVGVLLSVLPQVVLEVLPAAAGVLG